MRALLGVPTFYYSFVENKFTEASLYNSVNSAFTNYEAYAVVSTEEKKNTDTGL
jgi:hypothetical protein